MRSPSWGRGFAGVLAHSHLVGSQGAARPGCCRPTRSRQRDHLPARGPGAAFLPGAPPTALPGQPLGCERRHRGRTPEMAAAPSRLPGGRRAHGGGRLCCVTLGESRPPRLKLLICEMGRSTAPWRSLGERPQSPCGGCPPPRGPAPRPTSEHTLPAPRGWLSSPHKLALGAGETAAPAPRIIYSHTRQARSLSGGATCRHPPPPG